VERSSFTVTLADRSSDLLVRHIDRLRHVYVLVQQRRPFETIAICVLPDHLHALWRLPPGDSDFPLRWSLIKRGFSRDLPGDPRRTPSKIAKRERAGYGDAAIGNTLSATRPILHTMSITSTSIPSSTASLAASAVGRTAASRVMSREEFCRRTGAAIFAKLAARSGNDGPRVGTAVE
jgi:hypothetical protein